jgi:hypothetical protein
MKRVPIFLQRLLIVLFLLFMLDKYTNTSIKSLLRALPQLKTKWSDIHTPRSGEPIVFSPEALEIIQGLRELGALEFMISPTFRYTPRFVEEGGDYAGLQIQRIIEGSWPITVRKEAPLVLTTLSELSPSCKSRWSYEEFTIAECMHSP